MLTIFLSHSSKDKAFARRLAESLTNLRFKVWLDEWEVQVGDSIIQKVSAGVERADFLAVVLTKLSTTSKWVEREWHAKYWDETTQGQVIVLPILLEECTIPILLREKKYADFRNSYESGLVDLVISLRQRAHAGGIQWYYNDFVEITDDWVDLFRHSSHLDLLMMYSATWRNTYLKEMREMLLRPGGRLRVVLPNLHDINLRKVYAKRLSITPRELHERIVTAQRDYEALSEFGAVELYSISKYLNHACYLFDSGGILALYSYQKARVPTPAFLLTEGKLLRFLRADFEWLVSPDNPECNGFSSLVTQ